MEKGVEAVDRALTILGSLVTSNKTCSLHEIAQATGLYKSTILRLLASLEKFGYVRRRDDARYQLGPACAKLSRSYQQGFDLTALLKIAVQELAVDSGETASFYVRDHDERVCVVRQNSSHAIRHHVEEGDRLPLDRGAAGLVILAFSGQDGTRYERIRDEGFVVSLGERDPDAAAVSVPIVGAGNELIGALSISGLRSRFTYEAIDKHRALLIEAAKKLDIQIGGQSVAA